MSGPRRQTKTIPDPRSVTHACVLDALVAVSEAALFALLDHHPDVDLPPPMRTSLARDDIDVEARRLLGLLVDLEDAVRHYAALAHPDDDVLF